MSEVSKSTRLGKAAQEFNVGMNTIVEFLHKKGIKIDNNANTKLTPEAYALLVKEYQSEKTVKEVSKKIELEYTQHKTISISDKRHAVEEEFEPEVTREELFIRNMPLEPEKAGKPQPQKEEKPVSPKKKLLRSLLLKRKLNQNRLFLPSLLNRKLKNLKRSMLPKPLPQK